MYSADAAFVRSQAWNGRKVARWSKVAICKAKVRRLQRQLFKMGVVNVRADDLHGGIVLAVSVDRCW